jgi:hypothetical protein
MRSPVAALPVNVTLSMPGCADSAAPGLAGAGDEVEHAGREIALGQDLGQLAHRQVGELRRLDHHRAAAGQRRADLPREHQQRAVPGQDRRHHAHRLAERQVVHVRCAGEARIGFAGDLVAPAGEMVEHVGGGLGRHARGARQRERGAVVQRQQLGDLLLGGVDLLDEALQDALAVLRGQARPGPFVERLARGRDRLVHAALARLGETGHHPVVGRVDLLEARAVPVDPAAVPSAASRPNGHTTPLSISAAAIAVMDLPCSAPTRCIAPSTAFIEALTMFASMPTPKRAGRAPMRSSR